MYKHGSALLLVLSNIKNVNLRCLHQLYTSVQVITNNTLEQEVKKKFT